MLSRAFIATVIRVIDGDSFVVNVDLQWNDLWAHNQEIRLAGCNAREHAEAGGPEATSNLRQILTPGIQVTLDHVQPDKYGGRSDARVALPDGRDLTELLIATGWAAVWNGRGLKPVPAWPRVVAA
jgi:endonuclease YncB( thermonuclease family)